MKEYPKAILVQITDEHILSKDVISVTRNTNGDFELDGCRYLELREYGSFRGKAIFLDDAFDYQIIKDENEALCLIAFRKPEEEKE